MTTEKKVLVVSYLFPPIGGIGVQRPLKFVRYLPDYGWHPVVLTTAEQYSATMDPSLLQEIPADVPVHRVRDPLAGLMAKFVTGGAGEKSGGGGATGSAKDMAPRAGLATRFKRALKSLAKRVKSALLLPDESILWALRAAWAARKIVKQHGIRYMYTTSGPHSTQIAGWLIRRFTGVKWVADFRDPWIDNLHYHHTGLRKSMERSFEGKVFSQASAVVTVTDGFKDLFDRTYPQASARVHVIRNGVDPADFPSDPAPAELQGEPLTFFYAGILYPKRSPEPFFRALAHAISTGRIRREDVRAQFAGVFDYPGQSANRDLVEELGIQSIVDVQGYMPREQVLRRMQSVDGLLLIGENVPESKMYVPGKLYEYLYAARPILAIMEDGEAARLIRESNAGAVCDADDLVAIEDVLVEMVMAHQSGRSFEPNSDEIYKYTRAAQAQQLAHLLETL